MFTWAITAAALAGACLAGTSQAGPAAAASAQSRPVPSYSASYANWAGYAAAGYRVRSVSAHWTVPHGHCGRGESQAAFWVGMDMTTVEQTGIAMNCTGHGGPTYTGWHQMYPSPPVGFGGHIRAGDHMTGSVTYRGHGKFELRLTDSTAHWSQKVTSHRHRVSRATAEVIVEASYGPLARFGTVHFTRATVNGRSIGRAGPQRIHMVASGHKRAATSALHGGRDFHVTWRHR